MAIVKGPILNKDGIMMYEVRLEHPEEVTAAYLLGHTDDLVEGHPCACAVAAEIAQLARVLAGKS